jgi:hypothetical protein
MLLTPVAILLLLQPKHVISKCHPIRDDVGVIDITKTLYFCQVNMTDPLLIYSYQPHVRAINVTVQFLINNLIFVNELDNSVTLDFFFKLQWTDARWDIDMWNEQKNGVINNGINLYPLIAQSDLNLRIWEPDFIFFDESESTVISKNIKLRPKGVLSSNTHFRLTVLQSQFQYQNYPVDSQNITIRFTSSTYANEFLAVHFDTPPIIYTNASYPTNGSYSFPLHPIWSHDHGEEDTYIFKETSKKNVYRNGEKVLYTRTYDHGVVFITISRRSSGILIRLAFPILTLMILGGLTFWASTENRIDSTMTILLAVSALYIVVFGNIPMLGYLTLFDTYTLTMYTLLCIVVTIHQFVFRFQAKDKWPLRRLAIRSLETLGRIVIIPFATLTFYFQFKTKEIQQYGPLAFIVLVIAMSLIGMREVFGLKKTVEETIALLDEKIATSTMASLSFFELLIYTVYVKLCCGKPSIIVTNDDDANLDTQRVSFTESRPRVGSLPDARDRSGSVQMIDVNSDQTISAAMKRSALKRIRSGTITDELSTRSSYQGGPDSDDEEAHDDVNLNNLPKSN